MHLTLTLIILVFLYFLLLSPPFMVSRGEASAVRGLGREEYHVKNPQMKFSFKRTHLPRFISMGFVFPMTEVACNQYNDISSFPHRLLILIIGVHDLMDSN